MNRERFHNELAMRLGYERIVNDKRIMISVEDSDDPWITLKMQGHDDIRFKASDNAADADLDVMPEMQKDIKEIIDAIHIAYLNAIRSQFC